MSPFDAEHRSAERGCIPISTVTPPSERLVRAFADDQLAAVAAVQAAALGHLPAAVDAAVPRIRAGEADCSTSAPAPQGRLGLLDSVELLPTFSWPSERAVAQTGRRARRRCSWPWKAPRTISPRKAPRDLHALSPSRPMNDGGA